MLQRDPFVIYSPITQHAPPHVRVLSVSQKRDLPGVLQACKQLRAESIPFFSKTIVPLVGPLFYTKSNLSTIPICYLHHVRKVYVADYIGEPLPLDQMPKLEVVALERRVPGQPDRHIFFSSVRAGPFDLKQLKESQVWKSYGEQYERYWEEAMEKTGTTRRIQILLHVYVFARQAREYLVRQLLRSHTGTSANIRPRTLS